MFGRVGAAPDASACTRVTVGTTAKKATNATTPVPTPARRFRLARRSRCFVTLSVATPSSYRNQRPIAWHREHPLRPLPPPPAWDESPLDTLSLMKTLVVCTDGSELAIEAGEAGIAILRACERVLVVSVADDPEAWLADDATGHAGPSWTPDELAGQRQTAQAQGRAAVEATISALRERGSLPGDVEATVIEGEPGLALCKIARDESATAIVIGSRGRGGIKKALLGSVSDYVVRNAPCPVVVTR